MKIAVNTITTTAFRGGTTTYLKSLINALSEIDNIDSYYLFVSRENEDLFAGLGNNFTRIVLPVKKNSYLSKTFIEQIVLPFYLKKHAIDLLFSPNNIAVLFPGCKQVLTMQVPLLIRRIRDEHAPTETSRFKACVYDLMLSWSVKRSDLIIAVSESIKSELLAQFPGEHRKMRVIYEGVDAEEFIPRPAPSAPKNEKPFILFVSNIYKYKNLDKLIKAFATSKGRYYFSHALIIVGADPSGQMSYLLSLVKELGIETEVEFVGTVDHSKMAAYYSEADLLVYPSSVESFGLPILEAMACGLPVIASNRMSVPEIVGDAGLIIDPDDIDSLADAIYRLINDIPLREKLIVKGFERSKMFTWEKTASETLSAFQGLINEKNISQ